MARIDSVVLGSGLNALGVVRALGAHGLRSAIVSHETSGVAVYSRHVSRHLVVPGDFEPAAIAASLGLQPRQATLFLTEEFDVMRIAAAPGPWQAQFHTYFYDPGLAEQLLSKSSCDRLSLEHGAPVPRTVTVLSADDLPALDALQLPCVLKPAERNDAYSKQFQKAYRVDDREKLLRLLQQMLPLRIPLVVQEWIEGADIDIYFNLLYVDEAGQLLRSFVGRKTLCWPPAVGGTAACMAAPECHEDVTRISQGFLAGMGFRGLIGIEYKRDSRDGRYYLIEPTVYRTDYQHEVAALNGSDWLYAAHMSMLGRPVPPEPRYGDERSWVDFPSSRYSRQLAPPRSDPMKNSVKTDAHFRRSDPLPGVVHYGRFLRTSLVQRLPFKTTNETHP
jgi:D-aspartate ligase